MKPTTFNDSSDTFVFDTHIPWPTLTILWWIHGDEIAWIKTVDYLVNHIENKVLQLLSWKLILAYGNQQAMIKKQRQIQHNMNRLFQDKYLKSDSDEYEIQRAIELAEILQETDYLLDIHSTSSSTEPFIFAEDIWDELEIANTIFPGKTILGWEAMADGSIISWDTNGFVHKHWGTALTLEWGSHLDKSTFEVSKEVSLALLWYLWMIQSLSEEHAHKWETYEMYKIQTSKHSDIKFSKRFHNFEQIRGWDLIYTDWSEDIYAEEDFTILLPNMSPNIKPWQEIFYYGRKV